jgi:hypothetical protein
MNIMPLQLGNDHIQKNIREFALLAIDNAVDLF